MPLISLFAYITVCVVVPNRELVFYCHLICIISVCYSFSPSAGQHCLYRSFFLSPLSSLVRISTFPPCPCFVLQRLRQQQQHYIVLSRILV
ncbi:hypothetical protein BGW80DRAFT_1327339 [Lactifluus volemus]|nr:hypothetical protein BGW80DRAFT_1327339 [Lactifluus volemus]